MTAPAERAPAAVQPPPRPRSRPRRVRARSPLRDAFGYAALRGAVGLLAILPLVVALRVGELVAWLAYCLDRPHRRIGMRNLALAFGDRPLAERRAILRR